MAGSTDARPLPASPVPVLDLGGWLQRGAYGGVQPVGGRLLTVLVFCAAWDPLSRHVLPWLDAQQGELAARGVRFLAVVEDRPEEVRAYLRQARLRKLAVVCDQDEAALRACGEPDGLTPIPYAVLHDTAGRVVWSGPILWSSLPRPDPRDSFREALERAVRGAPQLDTPDPGEEETRPARPDVDPAEVGTPPEMLTAAEAVADLEALHAHLRLDYAAHEDAAWRLAGRGSSWEAYHQAAASRLSARAEWSFADLAAALVGYLGIYQDSHLSLRARFADGRDRLFPTMAKLSPREGMGYFPDYWLDTEDPVGAIAAYMRREEGR